MSSSCQEPTPHPALLERWQWTIVALLSLLAFWIRVAPRFPLVFQSGFVNFQEGDAWYHVRVAENLVRHFPFRIEVDPYLAYGRVQPVAVLPTYDWILGLIAWIAGAGAPSEPLLHIIAAWYPAVLGALIVIVTFLLARLIFGLRAGLLAAATIATLPGHFLRVSSLGLTDHHVMESLLSTLFFLLILLALERPHSAWLALAAGLTLGPYLLTFHGSTILAGFVVLWAVYYRACLLWEPSRPAASAKPLYVAFSLAIGACLFFYQAAWMSFTIGALALGIGGLAFVDAWAKWGRRPTFPRLPVLAGLTLLALCATAALLRLPSLRELAALVAGQLMPGLLGKARGISELRPLIFENGHYTILPALQQFYAGYLFAFVGLLLLLDHRWERIGPGKSLILVWGCAMFVLSLGQLRMTYYYAVVVALLTGYVADSWLSAGRIAALATGACLILGVFAPSVYAGLNDQNSGGMSRDWKETLDWVRLNTPEPFGNDPNFYYARYDPRRFGRKFRYPPESYSVLAWWDYGYWIVGAGRRIPVTNPTQINADAAADFFLSQSESEAAAILRTWRARYVVVDDRLPLWPSSQEGVLVGDFPAFFAYSRKHMPAEYFLEAYEPNPQGSPKLKVFYLPAYYRSTLVRLFVFGGKAVDGKNGATLLTLREKTDGRGRKYREIVESNRFQFAEAALAAEAACRKDGCVLVCENPIGSCVPEEALRQFQPVFGSSTSVIGIGSAGRRAVQVYEFTDTGQ